MQAVVFFGHQARGDDEAMARAVPGIDLVLGTHSHHKSGLVTLPGTQTRYIAPYQYLTYLADVRLSFQEGRLAGVEGALLPVDASMPEDPRVAALVAELQQSLLWGQGEIHLRVALDRLRSKYHIGVEGRPPETPYRETIRKSIQSHGRHKKQSGGPGQFAELTLSVSPSPRGSGISFVSEIKGGAIPREFIPSVEAGIRRAAQSGVLAGYAVVDFTATLLDGTYHERDSSTIAFELAAAAAFKEASMKAAPVLLEPIMSVEVVTPPTYVGDVIGDLSRRRGEIRAQHARGSAVAIEAHVPLKEMFGYIGTLRALSSGRAQYTMQFERYAEAPRSVTNELVAA